MARAAHHVPQVLLLLNVACRIGYSMIDAAEKEGKITPGKVHTAYSSISSVF
jgi:hypothetical protein